MRQLGSARVRERGLRTRAAQRASPLTELRANAQRHSRDNIRHGSVGGLILSGTARVKELVLENFDFILQLNLSLLLLFLGFEVLVLELCHLSLQILIFLQHFFFD